MFKVAKGDWAGWGIKWVTVAAFAFCVMTMGAGLACSVLKTKDDQLYLCVKYPGEEENLRKEPRAAEHASAAPIINDALMVALSLLGAGGAGGAAVAIKRKIANNRKG